MTPYKIGIIEDNKVRDSGVHDAIFLACIDSIANGQNSESETEKVVHLIECLSGSGHEVKTKPE